MPRKMDEEGLPDDSCQTVSAGLGLDQERIGPAAERPRSGTQGSRVPGVFLPT